MLRAVKMPSASGGEAMASHAVRVLSLAAAPTFAAMALLTAMSNGTADILCASAHASPFSGMTAMYVLMSAFHAGPWLKWIAAP